MRVRRLVLQRHGQTQSNADSRMQGQLDTHLTDLGRAQALAAAEVLAKRQPLVIYSSDLSRAYDTALALSEHAEYLIEEQTTDGFARSYAQAFLSDVNWYEIATHKIEEYENA